MSKIFIHITRLLAYAAICLVFSAAPAFAQSQAGAGQITGIVSDANGAIVPNATVTLTSNATNQTQTFNTSDDGVYRFVSLQPGNYTVKAVAGSFAEQTLDVEVQVGRTTDANFALGASGATAEVTVTAEGIQTTTTNSDAVISQVQIDNLPINGRRFQDFAELTPTAQVEPDRNQISLAGQRGVNTNVSIDGTDYNQPFFGGIRGGERSNFGFTIPQEAIQEFQVVASGYSPEFGRSSGGVVNVLTKSGKNDFRGSAFYLIRPQQLSRNSEFVKELERRSNRDFVAAPTQQQFGGSFGGPIVKDKLFFFAAYEQQIFKADREVVFSGLDIITRTTANQEAFDFFRSQEDSFQVTNDVNSFFGRGDWVVNNNNRISGRYNFSRNIGENFISTGSTLGLISPTVGNALSNEGTEKNKINAFVGQWTGNFSATAVNEFRFQYSREDRPRIANAETPRVTIGLVGEYGTRSFFPTTQYDTRTQFIDSFTYIAGNHTLKFGGEFSRLFADQNFGFNQFGSYGIGASGSAALEILSLTANSTTDRRFDTTNASLQQQVGNLQAAFSVYELGFFAQNSWRVTPRLTLDFGLRLDKQFNPEPELGNTTLIQAIQNTRFPLLGNQGFDPTQISDSEWQFGPRIGFAWDVVGNSKSVLRGFGGIFYARTPLLLLAGARNNYRIPPGDVSSSFPFGLPTNFNTTAFLAANPSYVQTLQSTGLNCSVAANCTPNTLYRQLLLAGIDLNTRSLSNLPTLTSQQITQIANAIGASGVFTGTGPGIPPGADLQALAPDYENPRSVQLGLGYEQEINRDLVVGVDFINVNTDRLQRNRDINLFAPVPTGVALRPDYTPLPTDPVAVSNAARPFARSNPQFGAAVIRRLFLRESTARSLYRAVTFRARFNRPWARFDAYYTLSNAKSDDDNERNATGLFYEDTFNLAPEYGISNLDRTHQFVANPVFFLPFDFQVSSAVRLTSGRPVTAIVGTDLNGDTNNNERPYAAPGVPFQRNSFRNRDIYNIDLRVQKGIRFDESRRLVLSAEFFNILNSSNIQFAGNQIRYCAIADASCGLSGATNVNFLQLRDQSPNSPNFGRFLTDNNPATGVFQVQLGARFQF